MQGEDQPHGLTTLGQAWKPSCTHGAPQKSFQDWDWTVWNRLSMLENLTAPPVPSPTLQQGVDQLEDLPIGKLIKPGQQVQQNRESYTGLETGLSEHRAHCCEDTSWAG